MSSMRDGMVLSTCGPTPLRAQFILLTCETDFATRAIPKTSFWRSIGSLASPQFPTVPHPAVIQPWAFLSTKKYFSLLIKMSHWGSSFFPSSELLVPGLSLFMKHESSPSPKTIESSLPKSCFLINGHAAAQASITCNGCIWRNDPWTNFTVQLVDSCQVYYINTQSINRIHH